MREQDSPAMGRKHWRVQELPAEENGVHGPSLDFWLF